MSIPSKARPGYFFRAQEPPLDIDPRYEVACVQWRTMQDADMMVWCRRRQAEGLAILIHIPVCYISLMSPMAPQVAVRAAIESNNAWFRKADGEGAVSDDPNPEAFIDFRQQNVVQDLVDVHCELLTHWAPHGLVPDGLFLDYLPDAGVNWWLKKWGGVELLDYEMRDYIEAIYFFVAALRFNLAKRSGGLWSQRRVRAFGNGTHRCQACDGICYESFPNSFHDGTPARRRGLDVIRGGPYGIRENKFRLSPLIIPEGNGDVGDNIADDDVTQAVTFAAATTPGAVVFDNGGHVFTVLEDLAG